MTPSSPSILMAWRSFGREDATADARTDPPVRKARAPVFIQDAVTPFRGETLLLARLRADLEDRLGEDPD